VGSTPLQYLRQGPRRGALGLRLPASAHIAPRTSRGSSAVARIRQDVGQELGIRAAEIERLFVFRHLADLLDRARPPEDLLGDLLQAEVRLSPVVLSFGQVAALRSAASGSSKNLLDCSIWCQKSTTAHNKCDTYREHCDVNGDWVSRRSLVLDIRSTSAFWGHEKFLVEGLNISNWRIRSHKMTAWPHPVNGAQIIRHVGTGTRLSSGWS